MSGSELGIAPDAVPVRRRRDARWFASNVVLPIVFVTVMVGLVWNRREQLRPIVEEPTLDLAIIAALVVVGHFLNSSEFWLLYRAQGARLGVFENWMVFTSGLLGNLIPGQVGTIYKFRYMKAVHGLAYARSGSSYMVNLVLTFASTSIVGLTGVIVVAARGGELATTMLVVFVVVAAGTVAAVTIPLPRARWLRGAPARAWQGFSAGWAELWARPATGLAALVIDIVRSLLTAWRFQLAFSLLGIEQSFWYFAVIAAVAAVAGVVSITPGGLGVREALITAAAVGMGTPIADGLLAATVDRSVMLASAVVLGAIGFAVTYPRLRAAATASSK